MSGFWAGAVPPWAYVVGACLWMLALLIGMWVGFGRGQAEAAEEQRWEREQAKTRRIHPVYRQPPLSELGPVGIDPVAADTWLRPAAITTGEIQAITDEMDTWLAQHVYSQPADYGQWLEQQDR